MSRQDITNPEELFEDVDLSAAAQRRAQAENIVKIFMDSSPVALAGVIARLSEDDLPHSVNESLANMLAKKVCECTPDQLNEVVSEARAAGVWPLVKPHVLKRNEAVAEHLSRHRNLRSIQEFLEAVATADTQWLPGPIYDAAGEALSAVAARAGDINTLNAVADEARRWRLPQLVLPAVRNRQAELEGSIKKHYRNGGYPMERDGQKLMVERGVRALIFLTRGYRFIEDNS